MQTFSALLVLCSWSSLVTGEFPSQRPVTRSFDVFFDLYLNKRLSKQTRHWWFETPLRSSYRHSNIKIMLQINHKTWLLAAKPCWYRTLMKTDYHNQFCLKSTYCTIIMNGGQKLNISFRGYFIKRNLGQPMENDVISDYDICREMMLIWRGLAKNICMSWI